MITLKENFQERFNNLHEIATAVSSWTIHVSFITLKESFKEITHNLQV